MLSILRLSATQSWIQPTPHSWRQANKHTVEIEAKLFGMYIFRNIW